MATTPAGINYSSLGFDQGKPFTVNANGQRVYMSPIEAAQYVGYFIQDPEQRQESLVDKQERFGLTPEAEQQIEQWVQSQGVSQTNPSGNRPSNSFMRQTNGWDPNTGEWRTSLNQGGILGLLEGAAAVGGPIAASALLPAAGGGGAAAGGGGAAAGGGGGAGAAGAGGLLSSTAGGSTAGALNIIPAAAEASGAAASAGGGMSWLSALKDPWKWLDVGSDVLSGGADASAANRGSALTAQNEIAKQLVQRDRNYYDALVAREQQGRAAEGTNIARLRSAQHLLSPGKRPMVSPYSVAPRQQTDVERTANQGITDEMTKRLAAGNPLPMPEKTDLGIDASLMKPGWWEQLQDYAGTGLSAWGALRKKK